MICLSALIQLFCFTHPVEFFQSGSSLTVHITSLNSDNGACYACLFEQSEGFPAKAEKARKCLSAPVQNKQSRIVFDDLPKGSYAVAVYHDENGNQKMDTNAFGMPKESTAASNNAKSSFGPPSFEDAQFAFTGNQTIEIRMKK